MINKREILESASTLGLLPNVVEKDYVLGWILAGITAHPKLAESWVFKGVAPASRNAILKPIDFRKTLILHSATKATSTKVF